MSLIIGMRYRSTDGKRHAEIRYRGERDWQVVLFTREHPADHRIRTKCERIGAKSLTSAQSHAREYTR